MPLLQRRVEVDTVVLRGLALRLARNASGQTNWDDLVAKVGSDQAAGDAGGPGDGAGSGAGEGFAVAVQGIEVEDARIEWDDRQAGQRIVVEDVRLVTGALEPGAEVPVEAGLRLTVDEPAATLVFSLDGALALDSALGGFSSEGLAMGLEAKGEGLPADGLELGLTTNLAFDKTAGTLSLENLALSGPEIDIGGGVDVKGINAGTPEITGTLGVKETNLKNLLGSFGVVVETTDPQAMTRLSGSVGLRMADGAAAIDPLEFTLDETAIAGKVSVPNFDGPVVRATLTVDDIDVDRYLPPVAEAPSAQDGTGEAPTATAADPFSGLRTLDLEATAAIGSLKVNNLRMSAVKLSVTSKKGVLRVDPAMARLYDGAFAGLVELDARESTPRLRVKPSLSGIQVGPLLKDFVGEEHLTGTGEVDADIRLVGLSAPQIRKSLNGTARFAFRDGAVKGINLAQLVRQAKAKLGMGPEPSPEPQQTDFSEMSGSAKITDGVIENRDLQAKSPLLRIRGKGQVDLPADRIDYLVTTEIVKSLEGQGGKQGDDLAGVPIPVRIKGSLAEPKPSIDLETLAEARAKQEIEARKEEVQKKIEEKAGKEIGDALKGLFGR
jgi:AsmA protein